MIYTWGTLFLTLLWRLLKRANPLKIQSLSSWPPDVPLVGVVIPCYCHGQYVAEAIQSILEQTLQDMEIIVVNDDSTDGKSTGTREWIRLHSPASPFVWVARRVLDEAATDALYEATPFVHVFPNFLPRYIRREFVQHLKKIWKVASVHTLDSASHDPARVGVDLAGQ